MENCFLTTYHSSFMVHWWVLLVHGDGEGSSKCGNLCRGCHPLLIQKTEGKLPSTYTRKVLVVLYAKLKLRN
jgi:hypothetical protein